MVGSVLNNRFELRDHVGHGGTGAVFRTWDRRLERIVAVKVLEPETVHDDPRAPERFRAEALIVKDLDEHPGLVTIFDTSIPATVARMRSSPF